MYALLNGPNGCFAMAVSGLVAMYFGHEFFRTINNGIDHGYSMCVSIGDYGNMGFNPNREAYWDFDNNRWSFRN